MRSGTALAFAAVLFVVLIHAQAQQEQPQEETEVILNAKGFGKIAGKVLSKESVVFYGLKYGQAPVGDLRWRAPRAFQYPSEGFINATQVASVCMQRDSGFGTLTTLMDEDCLSLNIWVPRSHIDALNGGKKVDPLTVMIFIHGGGFAIGSGTDPYISGEPYSERNVILVTINYRLGPFGFLSHPVFQKEDPNASANFGFLDQKLALRWIRQNVASFGGNPDSLTVFGESAGGISILWLMTTKDEHGKDEKLFERAIVQSAPLVKPVSKENNLIMAREIFANAGWPESSTFDSPAAVAWLRNQSTDTIINSIDGFGMHRTLFWHTSPDKLLMPTLDSRQFPEDPKKMLEEGRYWAKDIDLIIGTTRDEGSLFAFMTFPLMSLTQEVYEDAVRAAFNETVSFRGEKINAAEAILSFYKDVKPIDPSSSESTPFDRVSTIIGDLSFQCDAEKAAIWTSRHSRVYKYLFSHLAATSRQSLGVYHASELPFVFQISPGGFFVSSFTDEELALSNLIIDQFVSFATSGSTTDAVSWPLFSTNSHSTLVFELPQTTIAAEYKKKTCDFWRELFPHGPKSESIDTLRAEQHHSWFLNSVVFGLLIKFGKYLKYVFFVFVGLILFSILRCFLRKKKPAPTHTKKRS